MGKQAVLLIHGIGEQRPMDTLRSFVQVVWMADKSLHLPHANSDAVWSKPYKLSENFELRRLTTPENTGGLRTDFFEFYWAHLMSGNKIAHVAAWAKTLLWRRPSTVPDHLRLAYWVLICLVVLGVLVAYQMAAAMASNSHVLPVWISLALSALIVPAILGVVANVVGDAARYLHPAPTNVQRRHEIRSAGVAILKALHEQGYERIVVVGHSLGSVIGYDVLTHAWALYNTDPPQGPSSEALDRLEDLARAAVQGSAASSPDFQVAQRQYFNELKANQVRWRVSDFVTVGCPLAHAEILLAKDGEDLASKFAARELPTSPPVLEKTQRHNKSIWRFSYPADAASRVPHHAAVFGPTRWTNLYFPNRYLFKGDLIGGKLARIFGPGVLDAAVPVASCKNLFEKGFVASAKNPVMNVP